MPYRALKRPAGRDILLSIYCVSILWFLPGSESCFSARSSGIVGICRSQNYLVGVSTESVIPGIKQV